MTHLDSDIPAHEGYLVEFKEFSGGLSVKELARTFCAFANTDGGDLYIGVTDTRQIKGLKVTPLLLDNIQNAAREECTPPVHISLKQIKVGTSRAIIQISVAKSGHLHSVSAGQTYIRVGTQDKKVIGDELLRLAESKSQVSYEEHILDVGVETIDLDAFNEYYAARKTVSSISIGLSPEQLLLKMGLAKGKGKEIKMKAGAFILFGKEEELVLLQRDFTFVQYDKEGGMYSYREDLSLPAVRLLDRLMELIRPYNRKTMGTKGLKRQETLLYPEEALREALLNAFAHRDYRIAGLKNECRIYPDRIEVISAGTLPNIITLENIEERHYSRNPKIMHALLILGLTEELGQGIHLMKASLKRNGNPQPEFTVSTDQFKVIFRRPKIGRSEINFVSLLDDYFSTHEFISRSQLEELADLGPTSIKHVLRDLLKQGYLEKIGRGPGTKYCKREKR